MKFRIIMFKKRNIIYLLFLVLLLITIISTIKYSKIITFNLTSHKKIIRKDLTGDGKEDTINISSLNNKYYNVTIDTSKQKFTLKNNNNENHIGDYNKYWPLSLTLMDISRDKIPEIFMQCSEYKLPVQYIYGWDKNKFKKLYTSNNNIIGFIDCNNNKTPKIVSGNLKDGEISFDIFIFIKNKLERFDYNFTEQFMGSNTIIEFINYIQNLPYSEEHRPNIFSNLISGKNLSLIGNLVSYDNIYIFQDAMFKDLQFNKNGDINEIEWNLNFKGISKKDNNIIKNYKINVLLRLSDDENDIYKYKIYSIN